ncbi:MAG: hypothetical protein ACMXYB_03245 [Candidatus Woesearchaeota archaeon]
MQITKISKIVSILVLALMLIFAGCSSQMPDSDEESSGGSSVGQEETSNEEIVEEETSNEEIVEEETSNEERIEEETSNEERIEEETSNEERIEEENDEIEVARRESEELDETQEQISDALKTLSATGSYSRPGGTNSIEVEITIDENGIIQSAQVTNVDELDSTSRGFVNRYNEGIEEHVVGKSLDEAVSPAIVNRSSYTAPGFNEALEAMREQRNQ